MHMLSQNPNSKAGKQTRARFFKSKDTGHSRGISLESLGFRVQRLLLSESSDLFGPMELIYASWWSIPAQKMTRLNHFWPPCQGGVVFCTPKRDQQN